jgi:hypothetical protein
MLFLFPAMLWGSLAAAVPLAMHLLMKPRPRKVALSTERFVRVSRVRSAGRMQLRQVVLLAMRMLLCGLTAFLLARAVVVSKADGGGGPVSLAVVVDDSASMGYRAGRRSAMDRSRQAVAKRIASLPGRSSVVVLPAGGGGSGSFVESLELAEAAVWEVRATGGGWGVSGAVRRAGGLLARRDGVERQLLVATDLTKRGCAGLADALDAVAGTGAAMAVLDVGAERWANAWITEVRPDPSVALRGGACELSVTVGSRGRRGEARLAVELDGREVAGRIVTLGGSEPARVRIPLQLGRTGLLAGRVVLGPADGLAADDARAFALRVREPAELAVVGVRSQADRTAALMTRAIAPPRPGRETIRANRLEPEAVDGAALAGVDVVLLVGPSRLGTQAWPALERWVRAGGVLWIVPGPGRGESPEASWLPARIGEAEALDPAGRLGEAGTQLPLLEPFADPANPPLSAVRVRRRLAVGTPAADAEVVLTYVDGAPAVLKRSVGAGSALLWTFSPDRSWSNLGVLGGQLVVLAQRAVEVLLAGGAEPMLAEVGQTVTVALPAGMDALRVRLIPPGRSAGRELRANLRARTVRCRPTLPGVWRVRFGQGGEVRDRAVVAGIPPGESVLDRLDAARREAIRRTKAAVVTDLADWQPTARAERQQRELLPVVWLLLLGFLAGEAMLANRFYSRVSDSDESTRQQ